MSRYGNNLIHWETREVLNTSKCYTGEEYNKENTKLRMSIMDKECELGQMIIEEKNEGVMTAIKSLKNEIETLKEKYNNEKNILISGASYEMFPDNTLIHCQLISDSGKNIKENNSLGNQLVWCKVSDQRCFYSDILYAVNIIKNGKINNKVYYSTRSSLVNWPRPNKIPKGFLEICDKDDNTTPPEFGHENIFNKEVFASENSVNVVRKLSPHVCDGESKKNEKPEENPEEIQNDLKKSLEENGMSNSDASFLTSGVKHMDKHNLKMAKVMADKGMDESVKQMFVHPTEGRQMSYGEMRSFYG